MPNNLCPRLFVRATPPASLGRWGEGAVGGGGEGRGLVELGLVLVGLGLVLVHPLPATSLQRMHAAPGLPC